MVEHYNPIYPIYEFGSFRLDARERLLLKNGQPVSLTPKAFDTLLVLVQNSGHALEKDELMKAVWPDSFVEEVNLAHNISVLRKALGEEETAFALSKHFPGAVIVLLPLCARSRVSLQRSWSANTRVLLLSRKKSCLRSRM